MKNYNDINKCISQEVVNVIFMKQAEAKNIRQTVLISFLFFVLLSSIVLFFHWNAFHSIIVSSVWKHPIFGISWWLLHLSGPMLLAGLVFFFKRTRWTYIFTLVLDVWILANMMYLRSNGRLIDGYAITMVGNMEGFWGSLLALVSWSDIIPFVLTFIYAIGVHLILGKTLLSRSWKAGVGVLLFALMMGHIGSAMMMTSADINDAGCLDNKQKWQAFEKRMQNSPYALKSQDTLLHLRRDYAYANFSVMHAVVFNIVQLGEIFTNTMRPIELTENELAVLDGRNGCIVEPLTYDRPLVLILVESLESWCIHPDIMPHLYEYAQSHPRFFSHHVISQIQGGMSSDGQLIINTGLLPVFEGAACFRFPGNEYPSLVDRSQKSITILTHGKSVWNQDVMCKAYGYEELMEGTVSDSLLFQRVVQAANDGYHTIQAITVRSHVPFNCPFDTAYQIPAGMPAMMERYIRCIHATDEGLGYLLDRIDSVSNLQNATIAITGDHSIFWDDARQEFEAYCQKYKLDYEVNKCSCPLLVFSPEIAKSIDVCKKAYQVDIYPTILYFAGGGEYWTGLGVNIADSMALQSRILSIDSAAILSDKLIKCNYFSQK